VDSQKIRRKLAAVQERRRAPTSIVTLTRGYGSVQVKRGSRGEELLRKAGWREAS